jgi:hypothetical protein
VTTEWAPSLLSKKKREKKIEALLKRENATTCYFCGHLFKDGDTRNIN